MALLEYLFQVIMAMYTLLLELQEMLKPSFDIDWIPWAIVSIE
jgi:hypothetical protein